MTSRTSTPPPGDASVYAAPSPRHGRGVFAGRAIRRGEVVERCPILRIPARDRRLVQKTVLKPYLYERDRGAAAIALGLGSLYNHSFDPNAEYELQLAADAVVFRALRDIGPGEEVTISYSDDSDLWFVPRGDGARSLTRSASNGRTSGRRRAATEETGDGSSTARRKR
jgi:uncharacterized protein